MNLSRRIQLFCWFAFGALLCGGGFYLLYLWDDHGEILFASAIAVFVGAGALAIGFTMLQQLPQDPKPGKKMGRELLNLFDRN